ncbi:MAG: peptidylprolyl isomerase [Eggerthellaceae bacterium]|nr:peptidylprolyl isomerase [Eggerthellaceae bacterium]CCY04952.1 parvulin-like peptidyl-prolyl isomerase [Eggerthella sp. CAG:1427]
MKHKALLRKVSIIGVSAACCFALVGCGGTNYGYTGGVAATVNGSEIEEDTITKYIQDFRTSSDLTSDQDWANWMNENSLDPSTVRSQVIDYYTEVELKKQACDEKGISVDQSEVDEHIESMKSNYSSDEEWQSALSSTGISEDQYRQAIEEGFRDEALMENVAGDSAEADDSEVLEMLNTYYTMFDGAKRSSHILFSSDDEATAQEVLDQINAGTLDFADAAKQYSTDTASAENGGDVGWDATNTFVDAYTTALGELSKGEVSGLVTSDYGIHIIKCTDEFSCDGTADSLDDYPSEFVDYISNIVKSQNQSSAYNDWFTSYKDQADIQINDMPEDVPYNLDMTQYESEEGTTDESGDGSSTEGSSEEGTDASSDGSSEQATEDQAATDESSSDQSTEGQ